MGQIGRILAVVVAQTPFDGATVDTSAGGLGTLLLRIVAITLGVVGILSFLWLVIAIGKYSAAKAGGYDHKMAAAQGQMLGALAAIALVAAALTIAQVAWDVGSQFNLQL